MRTVAKPMRELNRRTLAALTHDLRADLDQFLTWRVHKMVPGGFEALSELDLSSSAFLRRSGGPAAAVAPAAARGGADDRGRILLTWLRSAKIVPRQQS